MPTLTIFTAPKPFTNPHIATIQQNAILSWLQLGQEVEILLIGHEKGMAEIASKYNIRQLTDVARNDNGTPLVNSIFDLARQGSASPLLTYVNADIMLLPDFMGAANAVAYQASRFLVIGQRWDLQLTSLWDFSPGWDARLKEELSRHGRLHRPAGSDYFLFPRELFVDMPKFAIGRAGWDNWMIYQACQQRWSVIDGTSSITVIHQDHDYSHLPGGKPHYDLDESIENMTIAGGARHMYMTLDADQELVDGKIQPARLTLARVLRRLERRFMPENGQLRGWQGTITRRLRRWRRKA